MVAANINSEKIMIKIMVRGRILAMMIVILMMMTMRLILVMMIVILKVMMTKIGSRNKTNINSVKVMMMTMRLINDHGHDDRDTQGDDDKNRAPQSDAVRPLFRVLTLVFEWWGRIELSRILSICQFLFHTFLLSIANFLFFSFFLIAFLSGLLIFVCLWIFKKMSV